MKKILFIIALLVATQGVAQTSPAQKTSNLMGLGMPGALANEVAIMQDSLSSTAALSFYPRSDAQRKIAFDASSDTSITMTFGDGGTTAAQNLSIIGSTGSGDDDATLQLSGAGAINNGRGANLVLKGENVVSGGGDATLSAPGNIYVNGSGADSTIVLYTNAAARWTVGATGTLTSDATNGASLVFAKAGTGVVQYVGTLAAAGSTQGDAGQIVSHLTTITAADATKGVKLPATPVAGETYTVINTANAVLKLYPGTGDTISGLAANANMSLAAYTSTECVAVSASAWWCGEPAVAA